MDTGPLVALLNRRENHSLLVVAGLQTEPPRATEGLLFGAGMET
jgi:hypothetical protein